MTEINEIIEILKENKEKNISIINVLEKGFYYGIERVGSAILVKRKIRKKCYISSQNEKELRELLNKIKQNNSLNQEEKRFSGAEDWMIPIFEDLFNIKIGSYGYKVFLPDNCNLPEAEYNAVPVTEKDVTLINNYWEYNDKQSFDYIKEVIEAGSGYIIYDNNNPVSWVLTHGDDSIGFLYVKKKYRKKGYGLSVTISLINELRKKAIIPFAHIMESNIKSLNMFAKLGFKKAGRICWFTII